MFTEFFSAIRVAYVASMVAAKNIRPGGYPLAYHHPLEQTIFEVLNESSSGVFVHWGVFESGKSTAVREAAWRLQEEACRKVIVIEGYDLYQGSLELKLRQLIGIPVDTHEPLSELFLKPATTMIIDHADMLMRDKDDRSVDTLELVRKLIKESKETGKFNVLLVFNSWERAEELVCVGCKLVSSGYPGRWTGEQLYTLFHTLPETVRNKVGENKDELLRLSTLSGTPGFLIFEAHGEWSDSRYAALHDLEWRKGTTALYRDPAVTDPVPRMMEGRFPDKNGIFHHNDLAAFTRCTNKPNLIS